MRGLCSAGLIGLLFVQPLMAEGPLTRSVASEAARIAAETPNAIEPDSWKPVRLLEPQSAIVVTTGDRTVSGAFVALDGATITVAHNGVPELVNVDDVQMVEKRVRRGSALAAVFGTLGGIWLGSAVAFGIGESSRCYRSCGGAQLAMWSAIVGVPIGGGYGAWRASSHLTEEVIYRRPASRP